MSNGAVNLKKIIKKLESRSLPASLKLTANSSNLLLIEKCTNDSKEKTEFILTIRIENFGGHETWWPIEYLGQNGESAKSESQINGRTLVNLNKQNDLIILAETWAKALEAQLVTQTVGNVLL
ncbi:MAG TPA: hypothetical protein VNJ08_14055 [Bacteriovoracaceae bacterium]|nr:hypothetical protein [Bacteriovoracaceae bacterium]